jgi:hypothetical protein
MEIEQIAGVGGGSALIPWTSVYRLVVYRFT